jgi:hypothetical protein
MSTASSDGPAGLGTNAELYAQREQRFNDVVALKKPDRVPLVPLVQHYFPTRIKGISNRDAGYDHTLRMDALRDATLEFGWDFAPPNGMAGHDGYEALATKQFRWPGGDLPDDAGFQFVESEYVRADEVDAFLADPNGFTLTTILPRIAGGLEGLGQMPLPPLYWFSNMYNLQSVGGPMLTAPPLRKALESLLALSDAAGALNAAVGAYAGQMAGLGYPVTWGVATIPAFDMVSDTLRSLRGSTLDIFRQPEKLLAMIDLMHVPAVATAVMGAKMLGNPRIFIPMHRGAAGFMSDAQFERFYWPTFVALVEALLAEGMVPMPLFEGDYTPRLKYLAQLPPGKIAAHFDRIDRRKFMEVCGETMCFWGNVQNSTLATGTPQQVRDEVKELVDIMGGRLILDGVGGFPDQARPENVMALREAADEYGVY